MSPEFVWHMEEVLDLYALPCDARYPQVCFDESPYQVVSAVRPSLPLQPGRPVCTDYEYKREGSVNLFLLVQPLTGWRQVTVTPQRTAQDVAHQMQALVDHVFPHAEVIRVVLDQLNTHSPIAFYQTCPPAHARRLTRKLEFHYTPKHGSWLNRAECEFAVLKKQCLDRHISTSPALQQEITPWQANCNRRKVKINWTVATTDARHQLQHLYPPLPSAPPLAAQPPLAAEMVWASESYASHHLSKFLRSSPPIVRTKIRRQ